MRLNKNMSSSSQLNANVINRGELPIVTRPGQGDGAGLRKFFLILLFLVLAVTVLKSLPNNKYADSPFKITAINLESNSTKNTTIWRVTGTIINPTKQQLSAPNLAVVLRREDGAEAAQTTVQMAAQLIPAGAALPFGVTLETAPRQKLTAEIHPLTDAEGE